MYIHTDIVTLIDCFCNRLPELISKKLWILRISAFLLCERNCRIPLTKDQLYNNVSMQWRHRAALSVSLFITGTCFTFAGLLLADKFALSRNGYSSQLLRWIANTPLFIRIVPKCVIIRSVVYVINYKLTAPSHYLNKCFTMSIHKMYLKFTLSKLLPSLPGPMSLVFQSLAVLFYEDKIYLSHHIQYTCFTIIFSPCG